MTSEATRAPGDASHTVVDRPLPEPTTARSGTTPPASARRRPVIDTPNGRFEFAKEFYVSPFYPVDGRYLMTLPEPGEQVRITVELHRGEAKPFVATVRGTRKAAGTGALLRSAARVPWVTVTALGVLRSISVGVSGRRLERDTEVKSAFS